MRRIATLAAMTASLGLFATSALAEPPVAVDRPLPDVAQEARAKALFADIRCVVCQHESISDSPAGIAADLRGLVREQVAAGRSDKEIRKDLVRRYGDYVLFTPPVRAATWLLWFGPLFLVLGAIAGFLVWSRRARPQTAPLTAEEEAALAGLLSEAGHDETYRNPPLS